MLRLAPGDDVMVVDGSLDGVDVSEPVRVNDADCVELGVEREEGVPVPVRDRDCVIVREGVPDFVLVEVVLGVCVAEGEGV